MSISRRALRRRGAMVGAVGVALLAGVHDAVAAPNFGGRIWRDRGTTYGGTSNIDVPSVASESPAPNEILLHRVVTQSFAASPGLLQAGLYRSGASTALDSCNMSVGFYTYYVEQLVQGSGTYKCTLYPGAASGTRANFKVYQDSGNNWRASGSASNNTSFAFGPVNLGYSNGWTAISTEANAVLTSTTNGFTSNALFGAGSGVAEPWFVWLSPSRNGYTRVDSPADTTPFPHTNGTPGSVGNWTVGTVPSPLRIQHTP